MFDHRTGKDETELNSWGSVVYYVGGFQIIRSNMKGDKCMYVKTDIAG